MPPSPLVSLVLPFHNEQRYLEEALRSVVQQRYTDWEFILVDDGSDDESPAIARKFAQNDARIRLTRIDRSGIVTALQTGCAAATGRYVARMDGDDIAHPDRLAKQTVFMEANDGIAACGSLVELFGDSLGEGMLRYEAWINGLVTPEDIAREIFVECPIAHPTLFMRRDVFEDVGGYQDRGWPEDYDLVMRIHEAGWKMAKVPERLLQWRHHSNRLSQRDTRYTLDRFRELTRHYLLRTHLANGRKFVQWGAGEVGKAWLREWDTPAPQAVIDVDPRKIGKTIHGVPVIACEEAPRPNEAFVVVAVGAPGARDEIRRWFDHRNYREIDDYVFVA